MQGLWIRMIIAGVSLLALFLLIQAVILLLGNEDVPQSHQTYLAQFGWTVDDVEYVNKAYHISDIPEVLQMYIDAGVNMEEYTESDLTASKYKLNSPCSKENIYAIVYTENQTIVGAVMQRENFDPGIGPMREKERISCNFK